MKPEKGDPGPAIVYRGVWKDNSVWYNNAARRDVVKFQDVYYIYKGADGVTNSGFIWANWGTFGSQFSSVATDLLLAVNANIGGWIFKNNRLESQEGNAYLNGNDGMVDITGKFTSKAESYTTAMGDGDLTSKLNSSSAPDKNIIRLNSKGTGSNYVGELELRDLTTSGTQNSRTLLTPSELRIAAPSTNDTSGIIIAVLGGVARVTLNSLPTSAQNLASGRLWRDGNTLKIV
jgi:hypothetical protein